MNFPLRRSRLLELLDRIRNTRIGVIGDFTLDGYWHADMERAKLSRETPLFPRPIVRESYSLGGAANVAWNLADLEMREVWAFSVLGEDWRGHLLRGLLEKEGIRTDGLFNQADRVSPFYGKIMLEAVGRSTQEDSRVDFINNNPVTAETAAALLSCLSGVMPSLNALIVADYQDQGVMIPSVIEGLLDIAKQSPQIPILVDSRSRAVCFQSLILKPNEMEAADLFFHGRDPAEVSARALSDAAVAHQAESGKPMFITRGAEGCLVCHQGRCEMVSGVTVAGSVDPVGAGDSFMAALAACLSVGAQPIEAAGFANLAASITVQKIGITGTASPDELLAKYDLLVKDGM